MNYFDMKHLVIVESPTKAKTIRKFLGSEYRVIASMGHVRDLPESAAAVPEKYKKTEWGKLGVDVKNNFEPLYIISKNKSKVISELKEAIKDADNLYLATDEDREGESISWHLEQILKPKIPVHRMVFHEITKEAIAHALSHPRDIDEHLVRAQEARRILDRLVGYGISPVLWKKIAYGLSAGRVQSAALKAIVDRERARLLFKKGSYWDVVATLNKKDDFEAKLTMTQGKRVAIGKDFDEQTGQIKSEAKDIILLSEEQAKRVEQDARTGGWEVKDVTQKPTTRRPAPPFITSTLQQEANRKLGLSSKEAMRVAQSLYEQGLITYMRTDSVSLSDEAVKGIRRAVEQRFGKEYVPTQSRVYANASKGAQEAHEAIRPSLTFTAPNETDLRGAEHDLYELIWMRALASQMPDSEQMQMTATLTVSDHTFTATGLRIIFPGFLRAYVEGADDTEQALEERERPLPELQKGDVPECKDAKALSHETKPPARFTEAGLVQFMEKVGIGRPSTYATVISTLLDRAYVKKMGSALAPTFTGFAVTQFMENHFRDLVDAQFTSTMEKSLDAIAEGKQEWIPYLNQFYLEPVAGLQTRIIEETAAQDPESRQIKLPTLPPNTHVYIGRYGAYMDGEHPKSHTHMRVTLPLEITPADLTTENIEKIFDQSQQGPTTLGIDQTSGKNIYLKTGSFGPYLQLGEDEEDEKIKSKQKRVSIPKSIPLDQLTHETAVALIQLPRLLGTHSESGKEIRAGLGRFGPYIVCDGDFRSLKAEDNILTVDIKRALELLSQPKGTRGTSAALRNLGEHPQTKKPITVHKGKYGAYVKCATINATIPKDQDPQTITLEQAVGLLAQRKTRRKMGEK